MIVGEYDYSRAANPTRTAIEANGGSEGGKHGLCFSSGAATGVVLHTLSAGDNVLLCDDVYGGTNRLFHRVFQQLGIETTLVDDGSEQTRGRVQAEHKLVWIETPTNPTLQIIDIEAVSKVAKAKGAGSRSTTRSRRLTCRTRWRWAQASCATRRRSTSAGTRTRSAGLIVNDDEHKKLKFIQLSEGSLPGIMECFLLLHLDQDAAFVSRHCAQRQCVAGYLSEHAAVER